MVKDRPLTFLAQFNCEELAQFDKEHLLPDPGLLSFFHETDTKCWGYDLSLIHISPKSWCGTARSIWRREIPWNWIGMSGRRLSESGFLLRKRKNIRIEKNTVKLLKYGRASQYFFLWQRVG